MPVPTFMGFDPAKPGYDLGVTISSAVRDDRYIDVTTEMAGRLTKKVIDTEERFIREGLIRLGWTPPA